MPITSQSGSMITTYSCDPLKLQLFVKVFVSLYEGWKVMGKFEVMELC